MKKYRAVSGEIVFTAFSSLHNLVARSSTISGQATGDIEAPSIMMVSLDVESGSFTSGDRLKDYATRDYLDYRKFPTISFKSEEIKVRRTAVRQFQSEISGQLTIMEATRPINVRSEIRVDDEGRIYGQCAFRISLSDFGLKPPKILFLSIKNFMEIQASLSFEPV